MASFLSVVNMAGGNLPINELVDEGDLALNASCAYCDAGALVSTRLRER